MERFDLVAQPPDRARGQRDRLDFGIFLRDCDEAVARQVAGRHHRL
jgi:hypothetical protein